MGTRGLLGFIIASCRHAIYNRYDSYPHGLGLEIVTFILELEQKDYAEMDARLRKVSWNTQPTYADHKAWDFIRDVQMGVENLEVGDYVDFLHDGIFCEWAYFIDFQNQKLEVWSVGRIRTELTFDEIIAEGDTVLDVI
ncbi:hypothetical protein HYPSUDRAFT_40065 [Hypholoma sublateritium FD-334 SS-4]|uniref:Uncharacterized protein n=1 Tax=Hypholoma sublateritium (strain FD-334 SS-4) TaxID=945553 RepID=A0A0D2PUJ4_HYPSF|nr:hypothetical protein HYPSUDRAFT_40065 [Hypholoma sublateritium FD-334 SS-4]